MVKKRRDTTLVSSGAEFLVLGELLIREIESHKSYGNQKAYDIVSVNPKNNKSARIQVKSKNYKNDFGFYLNSKEKLCDFYVFINTCVYEYIKRKTDGVRVSQLIENNPKKPRFFIMDFETTQKFKRTDRQGTDYIKMLKDVPFEDYEDNWSQIKDFLNED